MKMFFNRWPWVMEGDPVLQGLNILILPIGLIRIADNFCIDDKLFAQYYIFYKCQHFLDHCIPSYPYKWYLADTLDQYL